MQDLSEPLGSIRRVLRNQERRRGSQRGEITPVPPSPVPPDAPSVQDDLRANILLVDDLPANLLVLEATLSGLGENLIRAGSGVEALRRILDADFALILMDVQMPGMDGFETANLIRGRERSRKVPIIFLTAHDWTDSEVFKAYSTGAVDFLFKPLVPEILRSKVRVFVDLYRSTLQIRRQAELLREGERRELEAQLLEERRRAEDAKLQFRFRVAQEVQQKFFPASPPRFPGLDIGGASTPAEETGGDYFDYIPFPDGALGIAIGDVCGHGIGPALLMSATRAYLRALALTHQGVGDILALTNRALNADVDQGRFVTLFLARIDPAERFLIYANAGHPSGFILGSDGAIKRELLSTGLPLGILDEAKFPESGPIPLADGDIVLLLTDGIVEATGLDGDPFGFERAIEVVRAHRDRPAAAIVQALHEAVRRFAAGSTLIDDVTSVILRVEHNAIEAPGRNGR